MLYNHEYVYCSVHYEMDCVCLVGWCVTCCDVKEECTSVDGSNEIEKENR